jgi:peptide chain release factor subunit 1
VSVLDAARRLVEHRTGHPVITVYLDLDPEHFATPAARASQVGSLVDRAGREIDADPGFGHEERVALREDLARISSYLLSREPPFKGARALAVFCASRDGLFEAVQLLRPIEGRVVISRSPYVEPMLAVAEDRHWCVVLVSRRTARVLAGPADRLEEVERVADDVPGQQEQGGLSQAHYERSVEQDVDAHLRRVAALLDRRWRRTRFDGLVLGGPHEVVPRLAAVLPEELKALIADRRLDVDVGTATKEQVRQAMTALIQDDEARRERQALDRLASGIGTGGRAAAGPQATVEALNERRVETLLMTPDFDRPVERCSRCGLLSLGADGGCPVDGSRLEHLEHLREAVVEAAILQDAAVMIVTHYPDLGPFEGIGALLRF